MSFFDKIYDIAHTDLFKYVSQWYIFCVHSDTWLEFKTLVLIRLKPAKSSDIVTKPCKVVTTRHHTKN